MKVALGALVFSILAFFASIFGSPQPSEQSIGAATILTLPQGGTGTSTLDRGDILVASTTKEFGKLRIGTNGQTILSDGLYPYWGTAAGSVNDWGTFINCYGQGCLTTSSSARLFLSKDLVVSSTIWSQSVSTTMLEVLGTSIFKGVSTFNNNLLPNANNTISIGAFGTAFGAVFASGTVYAGNAVISGSATVSSTLTAAGLATLQSGYISSASSTVAAQLHVSGSLSASSSLSVLGVINIGNNIIPTSNNASTLGSYGNAFSDLTASGTLRIGTAGNSTLLGTTFLLPGLATLQSGFISNASSSVSVLNTNSLSVLGTATVTSLTVTSLATLQGGAIVSASSSFSGPLTVSGNLMSSGTIALADGYTARTMVKKVRFIATNVATSSIFQIQATDRAITLHKVVANVSCPSGCAQSQAPGVSFQIRHGLNASVSSTATAFFTTDLNVNSTSTPISYCASGCTRTVTVNDNTLATNEFIFFHPSVVSSSPAMHIPIDIYYSED